VRCVAFNQINSIGPAAVNVADFQIATLTFTTAPLPENLLYPLLFDWVTTPTNQRLDFFGVTSAPGVCVTVMDGPACPVPEPDTGGLLALGLAALAVATRSGLRLRSGSTARSA
jgi:PEP-CTERM motif